MNSIQASIIRQHFRTLPATALFALFALCVCAAGMASAAEDGAPAITRAAPAVNIAQPAAINIAQPAVNIAQPTEPTAPVPPASLDTRIQEVKTDVIQLNRDLLVLEEELLFPANTQFALFVSMDVGKMFELDSVQVKVDDKLVANYLYTPLEVQALHRGGVQRLFIGNLRNGDHELVATFTGRGPHERDYKRGATIKFTKDAQAKFLELRIQDSTAKLQPEFDIKVWQ